MTKADLIEKMAKIAGRPVKHLETVVQTLLDGIKAGLQRGERIEIRGFGSFVLREHGGYRGRNPKTGQMVTVSPKKVPFFKAGKALRERVDHEKRADKRR
jgi:integration host factor subunit beta